MYLRYIQWSQQWVARNERVLSPVALIGGFVLDSLTLRRVDLLPETILLYSYLALIGIFIVFMHLIEEGVIRGLLIRIFRPWFPLAIQFVYGSLFSAFIIFYSRSSSLAQSWPFLFILLSIFVGTEIFKRYHERLAFQLSLYFFGIFSFSIFAVPLVLGRIGSDVFLMSGAVAVVVFGLFFMGLLLSAPNRLKQSVRGILAGVFSVYVLINSLYFLHILPPIPLALKDIGVYHNITKDGDSYVLHAETQTWYEKFFTRPVLHMVSGEPAFVYSSVFTPIKIQTDIVHRWEYWSGVRNEWITLNTISFPVFGGRDGGYRGFSYKRGVFPGLWRVSVETPDGNLIGRSNFTIIFVTQVPLISLIRDN